MKRSALIAMAVVFAGCGHVTRAKEQPAKADGPQAPESQPEQWKTRAQAAKAPPNTTGTSARPETERQAAAPGRPQLATSPEGLMLPDGPRLIQAALMKRGYLSEHRSKSIDLKTSDALQRFQADNKLPGTGEPDRDTVRKLGLSTDKVFRKPGE
jgi:hypothetical protein